MCPGGTPVPSLRAAGGGRGQPRSSRTGQRGGRHVVDRAWAWQTGGLYSNSETSVGDRRTGPPAGCLAPLPLPLLPCGQEPRVQEGTRLSCPVQSVLGGSHCQKDPPPTPTPKQGSPSQPRSFSVLKGQRTGMMWRVQPGASSDASPAGPRHRVPTGSLRARLRDAAPAKGFSVSFGSGVLYPWCLPGLKL